MRHAQQMDAVTELLTEQCGVVGRRQLIASGLAPHDIRRLVRHRDLVLLLPGAYVNHTGVPTWKQRAWAALLSTSTDPGLGDVALSHQSALRIAEGPGRREVDHGHIHVAIRHDRRLARREGVVLHRTEHFDDRVSGHRHPPRIHYEEAILDVAAESSNMEALALLARVVGDRRTTARRLIDRLERRPYIHARRWIADVLADVEQGTHSVLEHGYLTHVVRPHRLPIPTRQAREVTPIGVAFRDASYRGLLVELDGRLFHSSLAQRDADLDRDLVALVAGRRTLRLGWGQVFDRPCATAARLGDAIDGTAVACGPACIVGSVRATG